MQQTTQPPNMTTFPIFLIPLVIELGNFQLRSATPWGEMGWFMAGILILAGLSFAILKWNHRSRPDPFI